MLVSLSPEPVYQMSAASCQSPKHSTENTGPSVSRPTRQTSEQSHGKATEERGGGGGQEGDRGCEGRGQGPNNNQRLHFPVLRNVKPLIFKCQRARWNTDNFISVLVAVFIFFCLSKRMLWIFNFSFIIQDFSRKRQTEPPPIELSEKELCKHEKLPSCTKGREKNGTTSGQLASYKPSELFLFFIVFFLFFWKEKSFHFT